MSFIKVDKPNDEWVNLDYVVRVEISGEGGNRSVRIWVEGELVPTVVASGLSESAAAAEARKLVGGPAPSKPRAQKART